MAGNQLFYELQRPPRWDRFAASLAMHVVAVLLLTRIALWLPERQEIQRISTNNSIVLIAPSPSRPRISPPKPVTTPPRRFLAKIEPPKVMVPPPEPKPVTPEPAIARALPEPVKTAPAPPKREVVENVFPGATPVTRAPERKRELADNVFPGGGSAKATVQKPAREVQTGGFGDPMGVHGTSSKDRTLTVASLGSFDLPAGPGQGNGTGGSRGVRGTVASAGFGPGIAGPGSGNGPRQGTVTSSGFGDSNPVVASNNAKPAAAPKPALSPVEILSKPKPAYTDEARQLRLEGEVLLEVVFGATGEVRILRVVRGLGHGLDESAQRAALQIRFRPARRDGQPYDSAALVHITFELAN